MERGRRERGIERESERERERWSDSTLLLDQILYEEKIDQVFPFKYDPSGKGLARSMFLLRCAHVLEQGREEAVVGERKEIEL